MYSQFMLIIFFFQAEDGIRYWSVTGVQTCALPISEVHVRFLHRSLRWSIKKSSLPSKASMKKPHVNFRSVRGNTSRLRKIGRASCRERGEMSVSDVALNRKMCIIRMGARRGAGKRV